MTTWRAALVLVTVASACAPSGVDLGHGVALTLRFDGAVTSADVARVVAFAYHTTGEAFDGTEPLGRPAERVEHLVYRPLSTTSTLSIDVDALDGSGTRIAHGTTGTLTLGAGQTVSAEALLTAETPGEDLGQVVPQTDMSTPDAAADLSSSDLATSACPGGDFCEDFETGLIAKWSQQTSSGTTTTDGIQVHSGARALHLHLDAIGVSRTAYAQVNTVNAFVAPRTNFWLRGFVWAASPTPSSFPLLGAFQGASPYGALGVSFYHGAFALYNDVSGANQFVSTNVLVPQNTWFCLEVHVTIGNPGSITAALDSVDIPAALTGDTQSGAALGELLIGGYETTSASETEPAHDLWLDDVVVSNTRVGCK